tara:strand:+ start:456 stop:677 length:222 start_codon:yes stop_codon:yes gene_type:complete
MTPTEALKLALEALEIEEAQTHYPSQWLLKAITAIKEALAQPAQEKNFCSRCGKRTKDLTTIHTCTPPKEKNT